MNDTALETRVCLASAAIYQQSMLLPVQACTLVANTLAILLGLWLLRLLFLHPGSFHPNTRLLLVNLSVSIVIMSVGSISLQSFYLVRMGNNEHCPLFENHNICAIFEYIRVGPIISVQFSLVSIAVERAIATWKYKTYEDTNNPVLVMVSIAVQWILSVVFLTMARTAPFERLPSCNTLVFVTGGPSVMPSLFFELVTEFMAGVVYLAVHYINKKKQETTLINQALHSLTVRYQLSENIRATSMMLPSLLAHIACFGPVILLIIPTVIWHRGNLELNPYHVQISHLVFTIVNGIISFYGLCHPIICILQTPKFYEDVSGIFKKNKVNPLSKDHQQQGPTGGRNANLGKPTHVEEEQQHFQMLSAMWKTQN